MHQLCRPTGGEGQDVNIILWLQQWRTIIIITIIIIIVIMSTHWRESQDQIGNECASRAASEQRSWWDKGGPNKGGPNKGGPNKGGILR